MNALKQRTATRTHDSPPAPTGSASQQIKAGIEKASVAYFPERYGEWLVPILEDVMAGNPVPSFTGSGWS